MRKSKTTKTLQEVKRIRESLLPNKTVHVHLICHIAGFSPELAPLYEKLKIEKNDDEVEKLLPINLSNEFDRLKKIAGTFEAFIASMKQIGIDIHDGMIIECDIPEIGEYKVMLNGAKLKAMPDNQGIIWILNLYPTI